MQNNKPKLRISRRILKWLLRFFITVVILLIVMVAVFVIMQIQGKKSLYNQSLVQNAPNLQVLNEIELVTESEEIIPNYTWQEGDIRYHGKIYRYNSDILTFLLLGIDNMKEVKRKEDGIKGGQSDAIFLLCANPHTEELFVIGINRDTIAQVDIYTEAGNYLTTAPAQITLQHGYGDGAELSCERSVKAVSRLFYDIPIHGYCAVNMGAIPLINDAVGGVDLDALQTFTGSVSHTKYEENASVHLDGMMAYEYLKDRDTKQFSSAALRLERQKQYLSAYAKKAIEKTKQDITTPVTLYQTLAKYMVTDISTEEVAYLVPELVGYSFDSDNIYSLAGETVMGEKHEEFYPDEEALYDLIIRIFYEEVLE